MPMGREPVSWPAFLARSMAMPLHLFIWGQSGPKPRKTGLDAYIEGASREAPFAFQRLLCQILLPATRALRLNTGVAPSS